MVMRKIDDEQARQHQPLSIIITVRAISKMCQDHRQSSHRIYYNKIKKIKQMMKNKLIYERKFIIFYTQILFMKLY